MLGYSRPLQSTTVPRPAYVTAYMIMKAAFCNVHTHIMQMSRKTSVSK